MSSRQVKKIVKQYAAAMRRHRFAFRQVYLFGSQATGNAKKYSDIDIAVVVTNAGRGRKYLNNKFLLRRITPSVDTRIEPILLEEREFKRGEESLMAAEVKKHGIRVR